MQIPLGSEKIHIQVLESIILWIQSYLKMDYVPGSRSSQQLQTDYQRQKWIES